jgi:hypothetical protein
LNSNGGDTWAAEPQRNPKLEIRNPKGTEKTKGQNARSNAQFRFAVFRSIYTECGLILGFSCKREALGIRLCLLTVHTQSPKPKAGIPTAQYTNKFQLTALM